MQIGVQPRDQAVADSRQEVPAALEAVPTQVREVLVEQLAA
jgi:hypothetical protein